MKTIHQLIDHIRYMLAVSLAPSITCSLDCGRNLPRYSTTNDAHTTNESLECLGMQFLRSRFNAIISLLRVKETVTFAMQLLALSTLAAIAVLANNAQIKEPPFPSIKIHMRNNIGPRHGVAETGPAAVLDDHSCQFACQMLQQEIEHYRSKDSEDVCKPDSYLQLFYATCLRCKKYANEYEDIVFAVTNVCGLPFAGDMAGYVAENMSVTSCEPFPKETGHQHKRRHEGHGEHAGHHQDEMEVHHGAEADEHAGHDMIMDPSEKADEHAGHDMETDQSEKTGEYAGHDMDMGANGMARELAENDKEEYDNDKAGDHHNHEGHTDLDDKFPSPADLAHEGPDVKKDKLNAAPASDAEDHHAKSHEDAHKSTPTTAKDHEKKQIAILEERVKEYIKLCGPHSNSLNPTNGTIPPGHSAHNGTFICNVDCECDAKGHPSPDCQVKPATAPDDCDHKPNDVKAVVKGKATPVGYGIQEQSNGASTLSLPSMLCIAFAALFI